MLKRPQSESVEAGEDTVTRLGLEVKDDYHHHYHHDHHLEVEDASHRPVVLTHGLVQVDPCHLALGEVDGAEVGDAALLAAVHPDLLADHQHVRVLVQHHLSGALPPQPGL